VAPTPLARADEVIE